MHTLARKEVFWPRDDIILKSMFVSDERICRRAENSGQASREHTLNVDRLKNGPSRFS